MLGAAIASSILLFTLSRVSLALLASNPKACLDSGIIHIRIIGLIFLGGMLLGFVSRMPPIVLGL